MNSANALFLVYLLVGLTSPSSNRTTTWLTGDSDFSYTKALFELSTDYAYFGTKK